MLSFTNLFLFPDPTFTVENVTGVIEEVPKDNRRGVWERAMGVAAVEEICNRESSEVDKLRSCTEIYVSCKPDSYWEHLVLYLYEVGEYKAAKKAKQLFLQQEGDWLTSLVVCTLITELPCQLEMVIEL